MRCPSAPRRGAGACSALLVLALAVGGAAPAGAGLADTPPGVKVVAALGPPHRANAYSMAMTRTGTMFVALTVYGGQEYGTAADHPDIGRVRVVRPSGSTHTFGPPIRLENEGAGYLQGIALAPRRVVYVGAFYDVHHRFGIWKVTAHHARLVARLPGLSSSFDLQWHQGRLYVVDQVHQAIWRYRPARHVTKLSTPWLSDPRLGGTASYGGASGLPCWKGSFYTVNGSGELLRIRISTGTVHTVATLPELHNALGVTADRAGTLWVARLRDAGSPTGLVRVSRTGQVLKTRTGLGLRYPTKAIASPVRRPHLVYVLNSDGEKPVQVVSVRVR